MNKEKQNKLEIIIDTFTKFINIKDLEKQHLLEKYSKMSDKEIIKDLSKYAYLLIGNNSSSYDYILTTIKNYNPSICPSIEEMKQILNKMFSNEIAGNMSLEENHKLINESLIKFTTLFNKYGIDYYIVGALPCFLKIGQPLFRYHDDIDIMINEDDIYKIAEIVELNGYKFQDDRFPSLERYYEIENNKPPHVVLSQNINNEFHLGFFIFKREQDNSITIKEYLHRLERGNVIVDVLERRTTPIGTLLRYEEIPTKYKETEFRSSSIENIYALKSYTKRPKDIIDMIKLEPYIDKNKLLLLSQEPNQNILIQNVYSPRKTNKTK